MSISNLSKYILSLGICLMQLYSCKSQVTEENQVDKTIVTGAAQITNYLEQLRGKNLGLVVNQTSRVDSVHLLDTLLHSGMSVKCVFTPEHGFRGKSSAGEKIDNSIDPSTGTQIFSLYGSTKKPSASMLKGVDVVVFDIQDVGARFYTYISTLHYIMEACAELKIPLIVLDRPNPNGFYVDGPVLQSKYKSFVGTHPIPVVHGMTIGEYGQMINGESWLPNGLKCELEVIPCLNYDHNKIYHLPIKPSPNLPDSVAIYLYPSICFFEGTVVSVGRGTSTPFKVIGYPENPKGDYTFTPKSLEGAKDPKHEDELCKGLNLEEFGSQDFFKVQGLNLDWLIDFYNSSSNKKEFFDRPDFFDLLAGSSQLRLDIIAGKSEEQIKASWKESIDDFKKTRKKYLLYSDFE